MSLKQNQEETEKDNKLFKVIPSNRSNLVSMTSCFVSLQKSNYEKSIQLSFKPEIANTSLGLFWRGLALYKLNRFQSAVDVLRRLKNEYPYNFQGMEYLSSALWHLKKDKEVACLARDLKEKDEMAPETWICMRNLDHKKFFVSIF